MSHIEREIVIERPVEEVFDFVADGRNEPQYNPHMLHAEQVPAGPIGCGTQFWTEVTTNGRTITTTAAPKAPSSLKRRVKEHPLVVYFVMAFGISWILWIPLVASAHGLLSGGNVFSYFHLIGSLGPLLAALLVTGIIGGATGLRELGTRMIKWRVGLLWWALALFGPAALYGLSAVLVRLFTGAWPDLSRFGQADEYPQLGLMLFWIVNIACYGFGEETGWRGFALPRLQRTHSALAASLVLSVFWALWHVPLFFSLPTFMNMGIGGIIGWVMFMVTGSILLTWLYNSTRGSILILAVFHGTLDIAINSPAPATLATLYGVLFTVLGLLVLLVVGPASLSRSGKQTIGTREPDVIDKSKEIDCSTQTVQKEEPAV